MEPGEEAVRSRTSADGSDAFGSRAHPKHAIRVRAFCARLTTVVALVLISACVSDKSLYFWGHYEDSVYGLCHGTGTFDLAKDVQILSQEVDRARVEGRRVAPGVHAHLGYLYYVSGNTGAAVQQFNAEKETYPESTTFIDGMLRRLTS
jgi:hypothetical protein